MDGFNRVMMSKTYWWGVLVTSALVLASIVVLWVFSPDTFWGMRDHSFIGVLVCCIGLAISGARLKELQGRKN